MKYDEKKRKENAHCFRHTLIWAIMCVVLGMVILSGLILSCVSEYEKITPPYRKKQLERLGLLKLDFEQPTLTRVVYPPIARNNIYKNVLDRYILNNKEIQAFFPEDSVVEGRSEELGIFKLGIYMYEYAATDSFISIAVEAEFKAPEDDSFSTWYAFNYDTVTLTIIDYDALFERPQEALKSIIQYLKEDVKRQKQLRKVENIDDDFFLSMEDELLSSLINSFVLLPSVYKQDKFIGLKIFLNRFGDEENSTYATQIPAYIFMGYLNNKTQKWFIEESVSLITESPYSERAGTFPDITPFY